MAKGKAVYPGPNEATLCGLDDTHIYQLKEIIDDDAFIESATRIVEKIRSLLSNERQTLSQPDKLRTLDHLNDRILSLHQDLRDLSNQEYSIIDRYLGKIANTNLQITVDQLWNLHAALNQARKDPHFEEAKNTPMKTQNRLAFSLAYQTISLLEQHNVEISSTASDAYVSDAIRILQILGNAAGLMLHPKTWSKRLLEAKKLHA